jgi:hypothetical protein
MYVNFTGLNRIKEINNESGYLVVENIISMIGRQILTLSQGSNIQSSSTAAMYSQFPTYICSMEIMLGPFMTPGFFLSYHPGRIDRKSRSL